MTQKLLLLFFLISYLSAGAYDFEADGLYYTITSASEKTCEVVNMNKDPFSHPEYCAGDIVIPKTVSFNGMSFDVTGIGEGAFKNQRNITSVTLHEDIAYIGDFAFSYCKNLSAIDLLGSVSEIGAYAFSHCTSLSGICLPDNLTSLSQGIFYDCAALQSLVCPPAVTIIGHRAFDGCSSLSSITIPASLESMLSESFNGCNALRDIYYETSVPRKILGGLYTSDPYTTATFPQILYLTCTLHLPGYDGITPVTEEPWKNFQTIVSYDNSSIDRVGENVAVPEYYISPNGRISTSPHNGYNIIRFPDGRTKKMTL